MSNIQRGVKIFIKTLHTQLVIVYWTLSIISQYTKKRRPAVRGSVSSRILLAFTGQPF